MSSAVLAFDTVTAPPRNSASERRQYPRYPIVLDAEFTLPTKRETARRGVGTTVDISSSGLLLACHDNLLLGSEIEVSIQWPILLDGVRPLRLRITGHIVRANQMAVGVQFHRYEFRTAPLTPQTRGVGVTSELRGGGG
jgi:c-di-GMP-binding flagellar brake protein YcgR